MHCGEQKILRTGKMSEDEIVDLKRRINEFIWQNAPAEMTLEEAERAAVALLEAMKPGST